jgi:uncharacterized membrane protein YphA (DoxX/SURF4 family)
MPGRSLVRAFVALYLTLGAVVLVQSVQTVIGARRGAFRPGDQLHAFILGSVEVVGALLFLIPRTMRTGAAVLLAIFALAFLLHATEGDLHLTLLVYAAGVLFVRIHGVRPLVAGA